MKHTRVGVKYGLFQPKHLKRQGQIPLTKEEKDGVFDREAISIFDDYRAIFPMRQEQYPEYYKNIPNPSEDPSGEKLIWWKASVPHINPVEIMQDSIAINQINNTVIDALDYGGKFDMNDLYDVTVPTNETINNNIYGKMDILSRDSKAAAKIGRTRNAVQANLIRTMIDDLAKINKLPGIKAQLMDDEAIKQHNMLIKSENSILNPHFKKPMFRGLN
jgi:hypothetical protein